LVDIHNLVTAAGGCRNPSGAGGAQLTGVLQRFPQKTDVIWNGILFSAMIIKILLLIMSCCKTVLLFFDAQPDSSLADLPEKILRNQTEFSK